MKFIKKPYFSFGLVFSLEWVDLFYYLCHSVKYEVLKSLMQMVLNMLSGFYFFSSTNHSDFTFKCFIIKG